MKTTRIGQTLGLILIFISMAGAYGQQYDTEGFAVPGSITGAKYGIGEDSIACVTQFSLYRENYRQWRSSNYENEAINYTIDSWKYVMFNCPLASQNTYIDGSKIIEHLYNKAKTPELKAAYVDTLMLMYDRRIMAFGNDPSSNEGFVLGRKGIELITYEEDSIAGAYKILSRAILKGENNSESAVAFYYYYLTTKMVRELGADSILIFDNYDIASTVIDYNIRRLNSEIENNPAEADKNTRTLKGYESALGNIENLFEPFATCDNLVKIYGKKFQENSEDTTMLERLLKSFDRKNCINDLYVQAADKLYQIKPSPESALANGIMFMKLQQYSKAVPYLQDAAEKITDTDKKADAYYLLADAYKNLRNYSAARSSALKVTELRRNDGKPWILIGDLYVASAASCGDDKVTSKAGYWAAVDKYYRAKSVDEGVTDIANSRISTYSGAFPSTEDLFFFGYKKGDSYSVGCWINETTTVRSSD